MWVCFSRVHYRDQCWAPLLYLDSNLNAKLVDSAHVLSICASADCDNTNMQSNLGFRVGTSSRRVTRYHIPRCSGPHYIVVGAHDRVLVLEDLLPRILKFREWLGSSAKIVNTAAKAIHELQQQHDFVFLDRDLGIGAGHGEDVAAYLAEVKFPGRVIVHSTNPFGADLIKATLERGGIIAEIAPFDILGIFVHRK
jgi:hypothetical protein